MNLPERPFLRQVFADTDLFVGARWWQESLRASAEPVSRRRALMALAVLGGSVAAIGLLVRLSADSDDHDISMDALDLQRREGWNAGQPGGALRFPNPSATDVDGGSSWRDGLTTLARDLAPAQASLAPFYVSTLLRAPAESSNASLRAALSPVAPAPENRDVLRGEAILSLFKGVQMPGDIAVILDLEGPTAVAVAAGMAPGFEPVFTFDNWPHPLGVVPSHLTLGAALYYRPLFMRTRDQRPLRAPPVFVLDRNRLARYTDEDTQFDNRYVARLPTAVNLNALGVKRVLYISPSKSDMRELDDLNDDFVALHDASIDVKVMALSDLSQEPPPQQTATGATQRSAWYYGGYPHTHFFFWPNYGWHSSRAPVQLERASAPLPPPAQLSGGNAYRPALRTTLFSSRTVGGGPGIGKQKPTGFARVSVRESRSTGDITGVRAGRSGSFGRAFSSGGG
jgi:hypothetical protein